MKRAFAVTLCVSVLAFAGNAAFAQGSSMSSSDQAMMKKCQSMSESAMKKDKNCMAMMKKHPDMMHGSSSGMKK